MRQYNAPFPGPADLVVIIKVRAPPSISPSRRTGSIRTVRQATPQQGLFSGVPLAKIQAPPLPRQALLQDWWGRKTEDIATFHLVPRAYGLGATCPNTKRGRITLGPKGDGLLSRYLEFGSRELGDEGKKKVPCYSFKLDEQILSWGGGDPGR